MEKRSLKIGFRKLVLVSATGLIATTANVTDAAISSKQTPERVEMVFWAAIENSTNADEFQAYIEEFPEGRFVLLAKVRAKALRGSDDPGNSGQASVSQAAPVQTTQVQVPQAPQVIAGAAKVAKSSSPGKSSTAIAASATGSALATSGAWKRGGWKPEPSRVELISADTSSPGSSSEPTAASSGAWKRGDWKRKTVTVATTPLETPLPKSSEPAMAAMLPSGDSSSAFRDCSDCPEMIGLGTGQYTMGSDNKDDRAYPPHEVNIDYPFSISKFEITTAQWNLCVDQGGCMDNEENRLNVSDRKPASNISWQDTQDYVEWMSDATGNEYRLPTEAEWEYAARAGTSSDYWWGNEPKSSLANCRGCGGHWEQKLPADIDEFPANAFGLHAMLGGVSEWVQDCWTSTFSGSPGDGSSYEKGDCTVGVLRGGSWKNDTNYLRSAARTKFDQDVRYLTNGFRIVRMSQQ